jgi:hypothetical protein
MTDFSLAGLDLTVLQLNERMYKIYEAKEPVLNVEITRYKIILKRLDKHCIFLYEILRMVYLMSGSSGQMA